jgi:dynein heavy chain
VPNLFASEEKVELTEAIRQSASKNSDALKQASIQQLYSEFVSRVKRYLHLVLCFSPIGDAFRTRMRMFPSLVNCCTIDWFQDWPDSGLLSVANKFLGHIDMAQDTLEMSIRVCQYFHQSTQRYAMQYWQELKRKLYVTPTSFLELIQVFKSLLSDKRRQNRSDQMKYSTGYKQIVQTESTVEEMQ